MGVAGLVNMSMLVIAASLFHDKGLTGVDTIEGAHAQFGALAGGGRGGGLRGRADGLGVRVVERRHPGRAGRDAGLHLALDQALGAPRGHDGPGADRPRDRRRPVARAGALAGGASFGIPFALVPLVLLTRRRDVMGTFVNRPLTTAVAALVAALIIALNGFLLFQTVAG